jgi:cytoskeleton protein RodZ
MADSTGTRLRKARLARGLSLGDVAEATRIRPEKLAALEADDFSQFPSQAYGRGFLNIYGKHLNVDVSDQAAALEGHSAIHHKQYQYLENSPVPPLPEDAVAPRERTPSIVPLMVFGGLLLLAGVGLWLLLTAKRLGIG